MPMPSSVRPSAFASRRDDVVALKQRDLVAGQDEVVRHQPEGQEIERLGEHRLPAGETRRQRQHEPAPLGDLEDVFDELPQRPDFRPAELVDPPARDRARDGAGDRLGDVADIDRLEAGLGAGERQHRQHAGERSEAVEEAVAGPEDHRGAQDHRLRHRGPDRRLGLGLGARIGRA